MALRWCYLGNHQDNEGKTPLHRTFESQDADLAKILISELNSSTEARDAQNWTPLHTAIDHGYFNYSHDLKSTFFHQDVSTEVSWIQLHAACVEGRAQDVEVLLDANTDVNHVSSAGYTPLHVAVAKNDLDLVTLLVDRNADVNNMTSRRQTPLHVAAENGNDMIIQKLLTMNSDPNLKDVIGNTSLHLSVQLKQEQKLQDTAANAKTGNVPCRTCSIQTLQAHIEHGVEVNSANNRRQTALWFACRDGQDEFVKILLHAGANTNISDKYGDSSLHLAIRGHCSRETIQKIIDHDAHVNGANDIGDTALLLASCNAQTEIVRLLLTAKADPNIVNKDGDASLHGAVDASGSEEKLQELIKYGADVNTVNKSGKTPLLLSCFYGQQDSVKVLLGAGADPTISDEQGFSCVHAAVDGRCNKNTLQTLIDHGAHTDAKRKDGTTALLSACRTGQSESVIFLVEAGSDVNIVKPDGNTCLYLAVHGHCSNETLLKIIEQGVNVNIVNNNGQTALLLACFTAQEIYVRPLLEKGADPNISNANGYSSILAAVYGNCSNQTLKEIITYKADLDSQNNKGRTALTLACLCRQQDSVKILLEAPSNPNIADNDGYTSLHAAVTGGCSKKIIKSIIDHGGDVNATDKENCTTLWIACAKSNTDAINVLLKAGSDTNIALDDSGVTCLMQAVDTDCSKEVLQALIDHRADVNAIDKENYTALWIACAKSNTDAINVPLKAGADTNIALDDSGDTCLMCAVENDCSKEVLQAIIDHGGDVNATDQQNCTALLIACDKSNTDAINVLLNAGADTNIALDDSGDTCLMQAVYKDCSKEVMQDIIDHGADVNATDKTHDTALRIACVKGNTNAVNVLLKAGADTYIVKDGCTCLISAVNNDCSKEVLQAIIDHGADVNATDQQNCTALFIACDKSNTDAINVLLNAGADTNIALDDNSTTCLMHAVFKNSSKEVLQTFIDHGADVNATSNENATALWLACDERNKHAISVLLKAGANTNIALDDSGDTCLMRAVYKDWRKDFLQAIIDYGVEMNETDQQNCTALFIACDKSNTDAINVLLNAGADTNITLDDSGVTCLMRAVDKYCSKEVLQAIIDHGADVNATDKAHDTALWRACDRSNTDAINVLLHAGADTNIALDDNGDTCLMQAVYKDCSKEVLQAVIDHGADVNATDKWNRTALWRACDKSNTDAINVLLKAGADTNIALDDSGGTCLMQAVYKDCSTEVMQDIIDHGADVNATDKTHDTALWIACVKGNTNAVNVLLKARADTYIAKDGCTCLISAVNNDCSKEVLQEIIDHGADVNATDIWNRTALWRACDKSNTDAINVLLKAGADTNIALDDSGVTCLMQAVDKDCNKEVLQAIIDHGADVNATNKYNGTALWRACNKRNTDAINVLLKAGADTNIALDANGDTCLMQAVCKDCSKEVLQAIIDHGADVNATNKYNGTALWRACDKSNTDAINVLLNAGADTNIALDDNGDTCLMQAVYKGRSKEVLQDIIDHGADVNATAKENSTALMLACAKSNTDAINVLLKAGANTNIALDDSGGTCLMIAVCTDCNKEVLQAIIDQRADVNATNKYNGTALWRACDKSNTDAINVLLKAGADTNIAINDSGGTCLKHAVKKDCSKDVLQEIIDHGADVNATNQQNCTALWRACDKSNTDAIFLLLETGAETNITNDNGVTCLMNAVEGNCTKEVLKAIIDHGADVNATSKDNCTALNLARTKSYVDAIDVLLEAGAEPNIAYDSSDTSFVSAL